MNERLQAASQTGIDFVRKTALVVALCSTAGGSVSLIGAMIDSISAHQMHCDTLAEIYRPKACSPLDKRVDEELVDGLAGLAVGLVGGGIAMSGQRPASSEQPPIEDERLAA